LILSDIYTAIRAGERAALGRAITLLESKRPEHVAQARTIMAALQADGQATASTLRIGISGAPGAGKSTLIETLGCHLTEQGHKVAVLAIDPSSAVSKGSILGDKTRMERLSVQENAFIRPSPAGDTLGGVARKTRETISLVEAAGYSIVLIETVGTGQSEIAVHSMSDLFLLVLMPGAGDELQGIKRGIVEMADILVVNKSDGDRVKAAQMTRAHYLNATHLLPPKGSTWAPCVVQASALEQTGIPELWQLIQKYAAHTKENGWWGTNRRQQAQYWLQEAIQQELHRFFDQHPAVKKILPEVEKQVAEEGLSPAVAAQKVLEYWLANLKS
jgi:LAO/AO transport system kinase